MKTIRVVDHYHATKRLPTIANELGFSKVKEEQRNYGATRDGYFSNLKAFRE